MTLFVPIVLVCAVEVTEAGGCPKEQLFTASVQAVASEQECLASINEGFYHFISQGYTPLDFKCVPWTYGEPA